MSTAMNGEYLRGHRILRCIGLLICGICLSGCNPSEPTNPTKPVEQDRRASSLRALKLLEGNRFDDAWD
ncbi:MAG: hypothetical protein MUF23_18300, partial [Pirellula sp.]|nr:hypothetical protein [Pirellula sp.]